MENDLDDENRRLKQSWQELDREYLDSYLVSGEEDPRINCQSILTRSLIADTLWPGEFDELIDGEMRFGAVLNWMLKRLEDEDFAEPRELLPELPIEGACPDPVRETFLWLQSENCPVPDYMSLALSYEDPGQPLPDVALDVFCGLWRTALEEKEADEKVSVLEAACGSANDYRGIRACGLSPFIDYAGFDIAPKNVANARSRFPEVEFFEDSILDCSVEDEAYEYFFAHDLYEHLSPEAMETALRETVRVTEREAWLHFFNAEDRPDHDVQPVEDYHINLLSIPRLVDSLEGLGTQVEVISIPELLEAKFGLGESYHNQQAVTLLVKKGT